MKFVLSESNKQGIYLAPAQPTGPGIYHGNDQDPGQRFRPVMGSFSDRVTGIAAILAKAKIFFFILEFSVQVSEEVAIRSNKKKIL